MKHPKRLLPVIILAVSFASTAAKAQSAPEPDFVSLFDGKSLDGWKVGDNAAIFSAHDGMIVMDCPTDNHAPAHLFYDGPVNNHAFKNFDLRVDLMTFPGANSGIYFHTDFQQAGFPRRGLECQVNNSHSDWRRTGSLYAIRDVTWGPETPPANIQEPLVTFSTPPVKDNEWYTQEIIYVNGDTTVKLNGNTVLHYQIPDADKEHKLSSGVTWLPEGTFALQGHPPMKDHISRVWFKNIRVKILPD